MTTPIPDHPLLNWIDEVKTKHLVDGHGNWSQRGAHLMQEMVRDENGPQTLVSWMEQGLFNPAKVAQRLQDEGFEYDDYGDDEDSSSNTESLSYLWNTIVGQVVVLTHNDFDIPELTPADKTDFLEYALPACFWKYNNGQRVFDDTHVEWLKTLCHNHTWAQEAVVHWCLRHCKVPEQWEWAINDNLIQQPSVDFVGRMLHALDPLQAQAPSAVLKRETLLKVFANNAPVLFKTLNTARDTYAALWGEVPDNHLDAGGYRNERSGIVHGMVHQQNNAGDMLQHSIVHELFEHGSNHLDKGVP